MRNLIGVFVLSAAMIVSCGKKKDEDSDDPVANENVDASSVKDLNLSGALTIEVPDSVAGSGSSLRLLDGGKSSEACRLRQSTKQAISQLSSVSSFFCHIEKESDNIPFNEKVLVHITGEEEEGGGDEEPSAELVAGGQYIGIYIDTTNEDAVKVYMCEGDSKKSLKLKEVFDLTGVASGNAKGTVYMSSDRDGEEFASTIVFDAGFTDKDVFAMALKMKFQNEFNGTKTSFRQYLNMALSKSGVSSVFNSEAGDWGGETFKNAAAARFNDSNGHILFTLDSTYNGTPFTWSHRSCVDGSGVEVGCDSDDVFSTDGELGVDADEVPGLLPADFEPDSPSGFKCTGWREEVVTIDMSDKATAKAHDSCSDDKDMFDEENCWSGDYQDSGETVEIDSEREEISAEPESDDLSVERK